jgi:hypothetical protein
VPPAGDDTTPTTGAPGAELDGENGVVHWPPAHAGGTASANATAAATAATSRFTDTGGPLTTPVGSVEADSGGLPEVVVAVTTADETTMGLTSPGLTA